MQTTALTTQEEQKLMEEAIREVGGRSLPFIPQIMMVNHMSEIKGMMKGEFYIRRSFEEDGERKIKMESIGFSPEITILLRRYTYSRYSKVQDQLTAWTNEFEGFSEYDQVMLIEKKGDMPALQVNLPYPAFKEYIRKHYYNQNEQRSLLKFRNVLYVKYENEYFRMFISNASVTGIASGEDHGDYKNPQKGSFLAWERTLRAPEPQAYFYRKLQLGHAPVLGKDYLLMTFEDVGQHDESEIKTLLHEWHNLKRQLETIQKIRFAAFLSDTAPSQGLPNLDESLHPVPVDDPF